MGAYTAQLNPVHFIAGIMVRVDIVFPCVLDAARKEVYQCISNGNQLVPLTADEDDFHIFRSRSLEIDLVPDSVGPILDRE
jgi:hypothetical protein